MGIFSKLFGKKKSGQDLYRVSHKEKITQIEKQNDENKESMIPVSEVVKDAIPETATVIYSSKLPEWTTIGNLIFEKKYKEAVELGERLLNKAPMSAGVHIELMDAYFKLRNENDKYFDLSTYHAKQAILCGHNTGYAHKRLVINLEKTQMIHQALQLCDLVLSKDFNFCRHGCGHGDDYRKRRDSLLLKINKSVDTENDILFTNEERERIIRQIKEENKREQEDQELCERMKKSLVDEESYFDEKELNDLKDILHGNKQN